MLRRGVASGAGAGAAAVVFICLPRPRVRPPFSTVAGGRDYITADDLHAALGPEEAKFLLSKMDGLDYGLDYKTFANKVFGVMRNS